MPLRYAIVDTSDLDSLDFRPFSQDRPSTCRKSIDGTKALISYSVTEYPIVKDRVVNSVTTVVEEIEVKTPSKEEVFGRKRQDNDQSLAEIQAQIPFSTQVLAQAYGGATKQEIKTFVRAGIANGDVTLADAKIIQQAIINYEFKKVDENLNSILDEFDDVIEINRGGKKIYEEGKAPSHSTIKSLGEETLYQAQIDQYGNLSRIDKIIYNVTYKDGDRVNSSLDTTLDLHNEEGDLIGTDVIENGRKIGSRYTEEHTVDEIRELMLTPEWKHPEE
jgi:hypothetical protein